MIDETLALLTCLAVLTSLSLSLPWCSMAQQLVAFLRAATFAPYGDDQDTFTGVAPACHIKRNARVLSVICSSDSILVLKHMSYGLSLNPWQPDLTILEHMSYLTILEHMSESTAD
ncbi:hypothetical protein LOK49_LG05G02671 [Camellia lanceoleosa]|uniref:Uncharacterized protein n=1 Tax=Camellia lanceoleosa TaxID=1840588 RepID=A0ACC0HRN0_9ERIC|nr:hypothetical protein LOK49_LG05G02671 [Camellia lanceoleosa]